MKESIYTGVINKLILPHYSCLNNTKSFIYFCRDWFFEGLDGNDGHTGIVIFRHTHMDEYFHLIRVDHWSDMQERRLLYQDTLLNQNCSSEDFNILMKMIISFGVLSLTTPERASTTASVCDFVGIKLESGEENWYRVFGGLHPDERHNIGIKSIFLGSLGLGSFIEQSAR